MTDDQTQLLGEEGLRAGGVPGGAMKLGFVAGVILRERLPAFERMLWRVCRGNVFLRQAEIESPLEDPSTGDNVYKSVFIIFFQGEQLKSRVKKICEGFRASLYPCPETPLDRREMIGGVVSRIEDLNTVLAQTTDHRHRVLVAAAKNIKNWFVKVTKIKAIYVNLNMFNLDVTQKCLIAECWCAVSDMDKIHMALKRGTERSGSSVPSILNRMDTKEVPPTYNRTNKFTIGFQNLVDSYGVAEYREINPAPFTIITFPFLFAVMFGDCGHGVLMTLFGAWMVFKEKGIMTQKSQSEIFNMFFSGRYLILMMGIFSVYTGLLYNDVFSKSLNIFGSSWAAVEGRHMASVQLDPATSYSKHPYIFGLDPVWQVAENKILYLNSYKMKLSVILGVGHMLFGVILSFMNHVYFKKPINIVCEFIPQVIFLLSIFGYMNLLIISKWLAYDSKSSACAPSILISMINMFLMKYPESPCFLAPMYKGQQLIQVLLVLLAIICIPWMLGLKPFMLKKQYDARRWLAQMAPTSISVEGNSVETHAAQADTEPLEPLEMGELLIHQAIHTIEYCLGTISHTASYLRLWALSLAHAQLSEVLWNMVMRAGLNGHGISGGILMYVVFAFWACITVGVLCLMEGLSAFLHALRLHWVEFQSKFYQGSGYSFQPFSFQVILEQAAAEEASAQ